MMLRLVGRRLIPDSVFLAVLLITILFSECTLFTSTIAATVSADRLVSLRHLYNLAYILILIRMIDILISRLLKLSARDAAVPGVVYHIVRGSLYFGGLALFYTYSLNRDLLPVLATFSVTLTVIGLALRELIFDAIAGIAIAADQNVRVGQWVNVRTRDRMITGKIEEWGWRQTRIRSRDNQTHLVPNSALATQILSNLSLADGFTRLDIPFFMSARADGDKILPILTENVSRTLVDNSAVDHSRPVRVVIESLEGERIRCLVQVFYSTEQSTDLLRSTVLETVRAALHQLGAFSEGFYPAQREFA